MLTDFVPGSTATLIRNPNYWMKNPIGPGKGDQLPYIDEVKILIIKDRSTVLAAFRTGKLDALHGSDYNPTYEEAQEMLTTNPETKVLETEGTMEGAGIRLTSTDPLAAPLLPLSGKHLPVISPARPLLILNNVRYTLASALVRPSSCKTE
jgi:ABC-type transport system substrate-binding protein